MKPSRIVLLVIALVALAIPATASAADQHQWGFSPAQNPTSVLPNASTAYKIWNYPHGGLGYGKRTWGVDLTWDGKGDWEFMRANERDHRRLGRDEKVSLYNTAAKKYLVYQDRTWGINLEWSSSPSRQWVVSRASFNGTLALYNTVSGKYLVYGERTTGINLVWQSAQGSGGGTGSTGTWNTGSFTVWLKPDPPVSGYLPYAGTFGQGTQGNLTSVQNPWSDVTLLFVKAGHSSNECGNANAVVALGPGQTLTTEQRRAIWALPTGVSNPPLPVGFVACVVSSRQSLPMVPLNIAYTYYTPR